jgi:signal transduction histidine kinase
VAVLVGYVAALAPAAWGDDAIAVVLCVLLTAVVARSLVHAAAPVRRYRRTALVATGGLVGSLLVGAWTRSVGLAEVTAPVALLTYQVVLCLVAVGLVTVLRRTATPAVTDLVVELDPARSGTLQDALARVLHDPGLQVGYWHAPTGRYVDARGIALNLPEAGAERTTTVVSRAGERFAALVHDPAVLDDASLTEAVGTATRLTASHAALQADLRAQVTQVEDSRRRLLLADDDQRRALGHRLATGPVRRLEQLRDHLAGLAQPPADRHVARALHHLDGSRADLAGIVGGLPPHELADGLEVALAALTERSTVPVRLRVPDGRFPAKVEAAVWFTCAEVLANAAKHAAADTVTDRRASGRRPPRRGRRRRTRRCRRGGWHGAAGPRGSSGGARRDVGCRVRTGPRDPCGRDHPAVWYRRSLRRADAMSATEVDVAAPPRGRHGWMVVAGAIAFGSLLLLPSPGGAVTTFHLSRPQGSTGPLAALVGVAWLAPLWVGWSGGPPVARSVGAVVAPLLLPALVHLVLALSAGRVVGRGARVLAAAGWVGTLTITTLLALFRNPLQDLWCWSNCSDNNVFLISADLSVARAAGTAWLWLTAGIGLAAAAWVVWRLALASRAWRASTWMVLVPAAVLLLAQAVYAAAVLMHVDALRADPVEPTYPLFAALFLVRASSLLVLVIGLIWSVLRDHRRRTAVIRLADALGAAPPPGSLEAVLARLLREATVRVSYWLPSMRRWVDAEGRPAPHPGLDGQATVTIQRDGEPVAAVDHDPGLVGTVDLAAQIGAAARLAIDNERMRAEVLAQLEQVRASRARLVAAGDEARRRLERDLHDGAQQRVLAIGSELRLARTATPADDPEAAEVLDRVIDLTRETLLELRGLAHGIFPAALDEAGLDAALWELSADAAVEIEVAAIPDRRYAPAVEQAVYLVVAEAAAAAAQAGTGGLCVRIEEAEGRLTVVVEGTAAAPYVHVADRVAAAGGMLSLGTGRLRAEVPCGSSSPTIPS